MHINTIEIDINQLIRLPITARIDLSKYSSTQALNNDLNGKNLIWKKCDIVILCLTLLPGIGLIKRSFCKIFSVLWCRFAKVYVRQKFEEVLMKKGKAAPSGESTTHSTISLNVFCSDWQKRAMGSLKRIFFCNIYPFFGQ